MIEPDKYLSLWSKIRSLQTGASLWVRCVEQGPQDMELLEGVAPAQLDESAGPRPTESLPRGVLALGLFLKGPSQVLRWLGVSDPGGGVTLRL